LGALKTRELASTNTTEVESTTGGRRIRDSPTKKTLDRQKDRLFCRKQAFALRAPRPNGSESDLQRQYMGLHRVLRPMPHGPLSFVFRAKIEDWTIVTPSKYGDGQHADERRRSAKGAGVAPKDGPISTASGREYGTTPRAPYRGMIRAQPSRQIRAPRGMVPIG
jgi:hypothetical protein